MIVACSLPNGLDIGGFVVKGVSQDPQMNKKKKIVGRYALTYDVPVLIWNRFYSIHCHEPLFTNRLIFGGETEEEVATFCLTGRPVPDASSRPKYIPGIHDGL
jgi:hypothetical protein